MIQARFSRLFFGFALTILPLSSHPLRAESAAAASTAAPHPGVEAPHGSEAPAADAHGGGHHGPAIKLFGKELGSGGQFLVKIVNFAIFAGALFFALKGLLSAAFRARTQEVEERLAQAERDKAAGQAQIQELEARMAGLQGELDELLSRAQSEAEQEKARILEGARQEAEQVVAQARQDIAAQQRLAEQELKALVSELAVKAAEDRLRTRLQDDTARRILDRAITQVGGAQ